MKPPPDVTLDLGDDQSPLALLKVCRSFARLEAGQSLVVCLDSPQWAQDLPRIVRRAGGACQALPAPPGRYRLSIRR